MSAEKGRHVVQHAQQRPCAKFSQCLQLKCVGGVQDSCDKCRALGVRCVRSQRNLTPGPTPGSQRPSLQFLPVLDGESSASSTASPPVHLSAAACGPATPNVASLSKEYQPSAQEAQRDEEPLEATLISPPSLPASLGELPTGKELEDLVQLFFSSVYRKCALFRSRRKKPGQPYVIDISVIDCLVQDFGFFAFIHPLQFNRLLAKGKAPREMTLLMVASAVRFAAKVTPDSLARADAWADAALAVLLPRLHQGFGAIQLMVFNPGTHEGA